MPLTSRDIEKIRSKPLKAPPFTKFVVAVLRLVAKLPPVNRYISESVGGLSGRIFRCWEKREYEKATNIAIYALEKYRNKTNNPVMDHHHWWSFMKYGVDSAKYIENEELREKLIEYANTGIEPFEGYDVAYSYLEFSKWKHHSKSYEVAIKYAEVASRSDSTWAEPDFILGWYGLLLGTGNAEEHLDKAVEKDHRVLFRIANNDVCKQYPHIVNKLKEKFHASEAKSGTNNASNSDS